MAIANPPQTDNTSLVLEGFTNAKDINFSISGKFTGEKNTLVRLKIMSLTDGAVVGFSGTTGNTTGTTVNPYFLVAPITLTGSGSGLVVTATVKAGSPNTMTYAVTTAGSGYVYGDTVRILGTSIGGATTANDLVLTIGEIKSVDLTYKYKLVGDDTENQGWLPEVSKSAVTSGYELLDKGVLINWGEFAIWSIGDEVSFQYETNGTRAQSMHVLPTKNGAHLLKYDGRYLKVTHNIDSYGEVTEGLATTPRINTDRGVIGRLSEEDYGAVFSTINSKSVTIGLGPSVGNKPKWAGIAEHKQFDKDLKENIVQIADAELSLSSEIPQFDDMIRMDTAHWYDSAGTPTKGGVGGLWTKPYYAAFQIGNPTIFLFRVDDETNFLHKEYYKYSSVDTGLVNPVSISTDGAHLFVLDNTGNGLIHCFKFTGVIDASDTDSPKISAFDKYNDNWPMVLPDSARGIANRRDDLETEGGGAWYTDIKVTPSDCRLNTAAGGYGRIWIQASWDFDEGRDYLNYPEGYPSADEMWYPAIASENDENEWLWSITLTNPAHPNSMEAETETTGRLKMINRSPSMTKFYAYSRESTVGPTGWSHSAIIRGDYDITDGDNPEGDETDPNILQYTNMHLDSSPLNITHFGQKMKSREVGIMNTFQTGLVDLDETSKIGVCIVWASSDKTKLGDSSVIGRKNGWAYANAYAEIGISSTYYIRDFMGHGDTFPRTDGDSPEIEACSIPAGQCVTLNVIDGAVDGWTEKPLIIPLAEDCLTGDFNAEGFGYGQSDIGTWGRMGTLDESRSLVQDNGQVSNFRKALFNSVQKKLFTFNSEGEIKVYDLSTLYDFASLETGNTGWDKKEFLRKNPFHHKNDYKYVPDGGSAVGAMSNQMPGALSSTPGSSTGFVQHPRAVNMILSNLEKELCYRDRNAYGTTFNRFDEGTNTFSKSKWNQLYGGYTSGYVGSQRVFLLPYELGATKHTTITHNPIEPTTMWDFKSTSIYIDGGQTIITNQKQPSISYIDSSNISTGITPVSTTVGYKATEPTLVITGDDTVGNGAPADTNDRIGTIFSAGKSRFVGWWDKDKPADGDGANALPSTANAVDYIYYAFSFMYDGYQESVLSSPFGSTVDTLSGFSVQTTGDSLNIQIKIPNVDEVSPRVSHVCIYRSKLFEDVPSPKAFFQLVEQVALSDIRWTQVGTGREWACSIEDKGKGGAQYEVRTGMSELIDNTQPHYGIATKGDGFLFIGQTWHQSLDKKENFIFRSKQGKYNMYDWATDWLELPEYPTALSYFGGKLFAFSKQTCWLINPMTMQIEEDILQAGCLGPESIISCDYGMFWADSESIWMYSGSRFKNIGLAIQDGGGYSYRRRDRDNTKVHVEFDALTKTFCVFMKPKKAYVDMDNTSNTGDNVENGYQGVVWAYHVEKGRWDYWVLEDALNSSIPSHGVNIGSKTLATCRDWAGGVLYSNNKGLYRLGAKTSSRKDWEWISKNFVMGHPTLDKRFYKIRAVTTNGNPHLQYKVDDALVSTVVAVDEKVVTKKGKRIKVKIIAPGETSVDSLGIIYRKPKAK
tara:strand:+ start:2533 stop:7200 length:4668 start_codon:yes stop_codon:yes gene_type:complete